MGWDSAGRPGSAVNPRGGVAINPRGFAVNPRGCGQPGAARNGAAGWQSVIDLAGGGNEQIRRAEMEISGGERE